MFRNRRAKNSMPFPPGYIAVNDGHYRVPKKLTKLDVVLITCDCILQVLRISLKTILIILAVLFSDDRRGRYTASSAGRSRGLNPTDFTDECEYNKYRRRLHSRY